MVDPARRRPAPRSAARHSPATVVLVVAGEVVRADATDLCHELHRLVRQGDGTVVVCDVGAVVHPDVDTIDVLARLQLTARRLGGRVVLKEASTDLRALLDLAGLREVFACVESVEPGR